MKTIFRNKIYKIYYLTLFKVKTFLIRKINNILKFNKPVSYPYITGDGFRAMAQHIFDDKSDIQHQNVVKNDIVFVRGDFLKVFFRKIHPKINQPYILISHNSDENINHELTKNIDDKIIHWFAQNVIIEHKKVTPIPIGIPSRVYDKNNKWVNLLTKHVFIGKKQPGVFYSFSLDTNTKRPKIFEELSKNTKAVGQRVLVDIDTYYENLSKYTHNASPEGNGTDCHRTWESMYLGTIPIVESSVSTRYWKNIGLPIVTVDDWKELNTLDDFEITEMYEKMSSLFESPALYMKFWNDLILKNKNKNEK